MDQNAPSQCHIEVFRWHRERQQWDWAGCQGMDSRWFQGLVRKLSVASAENMGHRCLGQREYKVPAVHLGAGMMIGSILQDCVGERIPDLPLPLHEVVHPIWIGWSISQQVARGRDYATRRSSFLRTRRILGNLVRGHDG